MLRNAAVLLLSSVASLCAQSAPGPVLSGYVTRVGSSTEFDVEGLHIVLGADTRLRRVQGHERVSVPTPDLYLGQPVSLWGALDRSKSTLKATRVEFPEALTETLSGSAIVDLVVAGTASGQVVRADGRLLDFSLLRAKHAPGVPVDPHPNVWIEYRGVRQPDGTVLLNQAYLSANVLATSQVKLNVKQNYDPSAIPADSHQTASSRFFHGMDPKQLPPYPDPALQARVDRIGLMLVPAYQRSLLPDDPTKINFRFQIVDEPKWRDARTSPNGIILVPVHIAHRLSDDAELAAVLADNIATALEKQGFREISNEHTLTAAGIAGDAAGFFIPGASLVTAATAYGIGRHLGTLDEQQSGRVALALMHDAGYDLARAPEAWWTLASKEGEDPHRRPPPPRAVNQYRELGATWRLELAASRKAEAVAKP